MTTSTFIAVTWRTDQGTQKPSQSRPSQSPPVPCQPVSTPAPHLLLQHDLAPVRIPPRNRTGLCPSRHLPAQVIENRCPHRPDNSQDMGTYGLGLSVSGIVEPCSSQNPGCPRITVHGQITQRPDLMENCVLFHENRGKNHEKCAALIFDKLKIIRTKKREEKILSLRVQN